jgi:hypothetical protein
MPPKRHDIVDPLKAMVPTETAVRVAAYLVQEHGPLRPGHMGCLLAELREQQRCPQADRPYQDPVKKC